jgi:hypothetical protein
VYIVADTLMIGPEGSRTYCDDFVTTPERARICVEVSMDIAFTSNATPTIIVTKCWSLPGALCRN